MAWLPLPGDNGTGLLQGMETGSNLLSRLMQQRLAQQQQGLAQQQDMRAQEMQPLKMQELQQKLAEQAIINKNKDAYMKSQIEANNSLKDFRQMGGGRESAGSKDEQKYHQTVLTYNPKLSPEQLNEAINVYAKGGTRLSDGTELAPMNEAIQRAYDRAYKSTTTSPLITGGVKANAAEQEMPVLDKYISQGRNSYGDTGPGGISLQQVKDTFNYKDKDAQNRLGDYIASDMLAFDKAALQTRIAGTESGVTIINEAMNKAKQTINAKYPMLSNSARQRALETMGKALKEALAARNKYGIGASKATGNVNRVNSNETSKLDDPLGIM